MQITALKRIKIIEQSALSEADTQRKANWTKKNKKSLHAKIQREKTEFNILLKLWQWITGSSTY